MIEPDKNFRLPADISDRVRPIMDGLRRGGAITIDLVEAALADAYRTGHEQGWCNCAADGEDR